MHMTSECPDRCNHGRKWLLFTITSYVEYSKPGQYGDEKGTQFAVQIEPEEERVGHDAASMAVAHSLEPGEAVTLRWDHIYVSRTEAGGGVSKFPMRRLLSCTRG